MTYLFNRQYHDRKLFSKGPPLSAVNVADSSSPASYTDDHVYCEISQLEPASYTPESMYCEIQLNGLESTGRWCFCVLFVHE